ncbi:MAG TPA: hydrolase [Candidatus Copromorpha excrementigallinarum]|uniref:Hydrolase n=1 Tax=Candidatus Allocopromorpha excrementigallinarum TaxID=2840742 RepID=A0A9D1L5R8_9FIRM|nr:hydrolase [Candidatus Copromorpha excrementigallinarum]
MSLIMEREATLVVVDVQERLMPVMSGREELEERLARLVKGMKALGIPVVVTQQYTKGIGKTIPSVAGALGEFTHVEKTSFGCMRTEEFKERLERLGNKTVVLCGVEAHICVQQTALQLLEAGYRVYLVVDCIGSRNEEDKVWAVARMGEAGAVITTYESVLYEIMGDSRAAEFKEISAIVK